MGHLEALSRFVAETPAASIPQAAIERAKLAPIDLVRAHAPRREDIESVTIAMNQRRITHVNRPKVATGLEAKFSIQYTIAAALADGAISLRHFNAAAVARADLQDLTARVKAVGVEGGESLSQACELTVNLKDGSARSVRRDDAEGRAADAYPRYMKEKFLDCVEQVFQREHANQLFLNINSFERCESVADTMRRLVCVEQSNQQADKVRAAK